MEHARAHGYPVPAARALNDTDIVMERARRPDDAGGHDADAHGGRHRHAATLATLLDRLHAITAPDWLAAPLGEGDALLHLDLHPENVILTPRGPVVIDWPNAARGPGAADVAHTWIVLACSAAAGGSAQAGRSRWAVGGSSWRCSCAATRAPSSAAHLSGGWRLPRRQPHAAARGAGVDQAMLERHR